MVRFLADENFNNWIVDGLRRRLPEIDIARVQDVGLMGASDEDVLTWAAEAGRIVLTHDVGTMTDEAYRRVRARLSMPGVVEVPEAFSIGQAIEQIQVIAECSREEEWESQVIYLPF